MYIVTNNTLSRRLISGPMIAKSKSESTVLKSEFIRTDKSLQMYSAFHVY